LTDKRVTFFRSALEALIESLDATVRIVRWSDAEAIPDPLQQSAGQIVDRLGTANRLASSKFAGSQSLADVMATMSAAVRRLDAAYVAYRARLDVAPAERDDAANALDREIGEVRADAHRWS
jgi:hypothetical protein